VYSAVAFFPGYSFKLELLLWGHHGVLL